MNPLDFSPISQREQQSIDTFSFLHPLHPQNNSTQLKRSIHKSNSKTASANKIFEKLCRIHHNKQSYGFQLLKQFILFSSDEQTIQIHYKWGQYELDSAIDHLQNAYGLQVKLRLVKAFQEIKNYAKKKKIYTNVHSLKKLMNASEQIIESKKIQKYRMVFDIFHKLVFQHNFKSKQFDSFEQQQQHQVRNYNKDLIKSMSHTYFRTVSKTNKQYPEPTHRDQTLFKQNHTSKPMSMRGTPIKAKQKYDTFIKTQRIKKQDGSINQNNIQNIIVIRGSKPSHKSGQPDKYIRVPITAQQVKIVQLLPEKRKKSEQRRKGSRESREYREGRQSRQSRQNRYQANDEHMKECFGCKFCSVIKQMEAYRLKRTTVRPLNFI